MQVQVKAWMLAQVKVQMMAQEKAWMLAQVKVQMMPISHPEYQKMNGL